MHKIRLLLLMLLCSGLLSACFRDAGTDSSESNTVRVENLVTIPAATPTLTSATLATTPTLSPTENTPASASSAQNTNTPASEAGSGATAAPTRESAATLTPTSSRSQFGDPGVTPTNTLATQPVPDALITPTAIAEESQECVHFVQEGDTLFGIAREYEIEVDALLGVNPALAANPNALQIGQALQLPDCTPEGETTDAAASQGESSAAPSTPQPPLGMSTHTVQAGDTLFGLATRYGTTVANIVAANPGVLQDENTPIFPGDVLNIPGGQ